MVQHKADHVLKTLTDQDWGFFSSVQQVEVEQIPIAHTGERRPWTQEEDALLLKSVQEHGSANWTMVAKQLKGRQPKQCRQRYFNKVRHELKASIHLRRMHGIVEIFLSSAPT